MSELEQELLSFSAEEEEADGSDDLALFKKASSKRKKRKKNKLFSEIDGILEDSFTGDDDMEFVNSLKLKSKDKNKADGDLFDTDGKTNKKFKNVEAKFKPEIANLQRILKDNEDTAKTIKDVLKPILSSKARGSSKVIADLLAALNSSNNNRLAVVKELSSVKKTIYDLKIKLQKDQDQSTLGMSSDQFGSKLFDDLFKMGRANVIEKADSYNKDFPDFVSKNDTSDSSFDDIVEGRLSTEPSYRSEEGSRMIQYETRHPEIVIHRSFSTGDFYAVAIDDAGVVIDEYDVPTNEQLGKVIFNAESHTCTDATGRVYKYIEVE